MKTPRFKAVIIDDEHDSREMIGLFLEEMFPLIAIAEKADGVETGYQAIQLHNPDIVFLDIEMHDGTGFDLLERIPQRSCLVIFITAYDQYAIKALKTAAFDYILKPINRDEFRTGISKAMTRMDQQHQQWSMVELISHLHQQLEVRKIGIPNLTGLTFVNVDTIIRCEADGNYTIVYFTDAPKALVSKSLTHFENDLRRYGFIRIHHKHLVNLKQVRAYSKGKGGGFITMNDKATLEVSARKKSDLINALSMNDL